MLDTLCTNSWSESALEVTLRARFVRLDSSKSMEWAVNHVASTWDLRPFCSRSSTGSDTTSKRFVMCVCVCVCVRVVVCFDIG